MFFFLFSSGNNQVMPVFSNKVYFEWVDEISLCSVKSKFLPWVMLVCKLRSYSCLSLTVSLIKEWRLYSNFMCCSIAVNISVFNGKASCAALMSLLTPWESLPGWLAVWRSQQLLVCMWPCGWNGNISAVVSETRIFILPIFRSKSRNRFFF